LLGSAGGGNERYKEIRQLPARLAIRRGDAVIANFYTRMGQWLAVPLAAELHGDIDRPLELEFIGHHPMVPLRRRLPNGKAPEARALDVGATSALGMPSIPHCTQKLHAVIGQFVPTSEQIWPATPEMPGIRPMFSFLTVRFHDSARLGLPPPFGTCL
jgi:hypothetical protein